MGGQWKRPRRLLHHHRLLHQQIALACQTALFVMIRLRAPTMTCARAQSVQGRRPNGGVRTTQYSRTLKATTAVIGLALTVLQTRATWSRGIAKPFMVRVQQAATSVKNGKGLGGVGEERHLTQVAVIPHKTPAEMPHVGGMGLTSLRANVMSLQSLSVIATLYLAPKCTEL